MSFIVVYYWDLDMMYMCFVFCSVYGRFQLGNSGEHRHLVCLRAVVMTKVTW